METSSTVRLFQYALVFFIAITLNFALPRVLPGDPLMLLAGGNADLLPPEEQARVLREAGLDRPLFDQYVSYLGRLSRFDLGFSYHFKRPISEVVFGRLPWSLLLVVMGLLLATGLGCALGALAAVRRGGRLDIGLSALAVFLESLPVFWVGMVLIAIFAGTLRLLPSFGLISPGTTPGPEALPDVLRHLVLPIFTLAIARFGGIFLLTRYTLAGVMAEDYIRAARGRGLRESRLVAGHALRNALLPVCTLVALNFGTSLGSIAVVETVFSFPGIGRMLYEAVLGRDYPVLEAGFLVITTMVLLANVLADLTYPWIDPRVRASALG